MNRTHYDSVNARDFALLNEDTLDFSALKKKQETDWSSIFEKIKNQPTSVNSKQNFNNPFTQDYTTKNTNQQKGLSGIGDMISQNPLGSLIVGALIAGACYLTYKYITKPEESVEEDTHRVSRTKVRVRRSSTGRSRKTETNITINKNISTDPDETVEGNQDSVTEKEEVSPKKIGLSIASAIGGGVIGAVLGKSSLLASLPLAIAGVSKSNWYMTSAAVGMGLSGAVKGSKEKDGNILERIISNIGDYLKELLDKLFPTTNEKLPEGAVNTMLGYVVPKTS